VASIIPDEGLDLFIARCVKNATPFASTFLLLFTSQTSTTVPASSSVLATYTGVSEASYSAYARQTLAAATWGATGAKTSWGKTIRGATYSQVSFPAATAGYATPINGLGIADASGHGSEHGLMYSNFDDSTAVASLLTGDVIKVTPTFGLGSVPG
jgi:hypothetical protein